MLTAVLEAARDQGFLGPGPVEAHVAHSRAMAELLGPPPGPFLDLGSGGGVPGLVLALAWPNATGVLLDRRVRSAAFLAEAIARLGLSDRLTVATVRAEAAARDPDLRGGFALVVARAFGPPAATAECGVGFLREGGRLAVSEPPNADPTTRWPTDGLTRLGLLAPEILHGPETTVAVLTLNSRADDKWPRNPGTPKKRPLW